MRCLGCPSPNVANRFRQRERGASPRHGCEITFFKGGAGRLPELGSSIGTKQLDFALVINTASILAI